MTRPALSRALAVAFMVGLAPAVACAEGDPEAGRKKAEPCAACHGQNGLSIAEVWPNLAGQKRGYLVKQMRAFRDGTRKDPIMSSFAERLTDQDIDDLAAFYSQLASGVSKPGW